MSRKRRVQGQVAIVLHAHLPFVRHPEHDDFLEEDWFYEAAIETYVPVLGALVRLAREEVPFRIAMTITAPLAAMMADPLLRKRLHRRLASLQELAAREARFHRADAFAPAARHYVERFAMVEHTLDGWGWDLLRPVRALAAAGRLQVLACTATHGYLPLMSTRQARRAQVLTGAAEHRRVFGARPEGMWLAECGWDHDLGALLRDAGVGHTFVESEGLGWARPAPRRGPWAPVRTPEGVAVFARDPECGRQVWSAQEGYPGDFNYREFYRDIGFDAGYDYIRPFLHDDGVRRHVGLKYHRVTGDVGLGGKALWHPDAAAQRAHDHARNFVFNRTHQLGYRAAQPGFAGDRVPAVLAPYDAELFGHWWYEGPWFLEAVLRALADEPELEAVTPAEVLATQGGRLETVRPNPSSWGDSGTSQMWLRGENAWLYRFAHWAEEEMTALVQRFGAGSGRTRRALAQMGRELLLMQSSDWAFILAQGTMAPYASRRFKEHVQAFESLRAGLLGRGVPEAMLRERERRSPLFPELDPAWWA